MFIAVEREGDTGAMKQQIGLTAPLCQQFLRRFGQPAGELPVMRADLTVGGIHFIKKGADHAVLLVTLDIKAFARPVPSAETL
ncbi:hypothetical protein D3C86_1842080 [compost metagenome]